MLELYPRCQFYYFKTFSFLKTGCIMHVYTFVFTFRYFITFKGIFISNLIFKPVLQSTRFSGERDPACICAARKSNWLKPAKNHRGNYTVRVARYFILFSFDSRPTITAHRQLTLRHDRGEKKKER